jgi:acetate kinase
MIFLSVSDVPLCYTRSAFHQSIPEYAYRYAIPKEYYEDLKIRRYGFHGTSHQYVARQAAIHLNKPLSSVNAITIHLGNGCSMTAIQNGKSIDTTMGMTPLEGLIMGTRCGDIDPALHGYLLAHKIQSKLDTIQDVDEVLNKASGLKGLTGTNDMRDVMRLRDEGNKDAVLAVSMYAYRIKKYIGSYFAVLGGELDAIIFTAGVGENASSLRALSLANLDALGIVVDDKKNDTAREQDVPVAEFHADPSVIKLLVIPTNEELEIAMQTVQVMESIKQ